MPLWKDFLLLSNEKFGLDLDGHLPERERSRSPRRYAQLPGPDEKHMEFHYLLLDSNSQIPLIPVLKVAQEMKWGWIVQVFLSLGMSLVNRAFECNDMLFYTRYEHLHEPVPVKQYKVMRNTVIGLCVIRVKDFSARFSQLTVNGFDFEPRLCYTCGLERLVAIRQPNPLDDEQTCYYSTRCVQCSHETPATIIQDSLLWEPRRRNLFDRFARAYLLGGFLPSHLQYDGSFEVPAPPEAGDLP